MRRLPSEPELWLVDLTTCEDALEAAEANARRLSGEDLERIAGFAGADQRRNRRLSYIALRLLIERGFGPRWRAVPFLRGRNGKPGFEDIKGDFSLAHTGGFALIGLSSGGAIGVDLEALRDPSLPAERRVRMERAAAMLAPRSPLPADQPARFLTAWARLEALGKADGRGVGFVLGALGAWGQKAETGPPAGSGTGTAVAADSALLASAFRVADVAARPGLFAAVAVSAGEEPPQSVHTLPADPALLERLLLPQ